MTARKAHATRGSGGGAAGGGRPGRPGVSFAFVAERGAAQADRTAHAAIAAAMWAPVFMAPPLPAVVSPSTIIFLFPHRARMASLPPAAPLRRAPGSSPRGIPPGSGGEFPAAAAPSEPY